jgi:hypothetical protein
VAAQLKRDIGIDADLVIGDRGEFTVWIDDEKLVEKHRAKFPEPAEVVAAVRARVT